MKSNRFLESLNYDLLYIPTCFSSKSSLFIFPSLSYISYLVWSLELYHGFFFYSIFQFLDLSHVIFSVYWAFIIFIQLPISKFNFFFFRSYSTNSYWTWPIYLPKWLYLDCSTNYPFSSSLTFHHFTHTFTQISIQVDFKAAFFPFL